MGKITIESASANGKDRRSQVISSELNIKSKQFKLCFKYIVVPSIEMWPRGGLFLSEEVLSWDVAPWRSIPDDR